MRRAAHTAKPIGDRLSKRSGQPSSRVRVDIVMNGLGTATESQPLDRMRTLPQAFSRVRMSLP
jgi:hypothetical protein